MDRERHMDRGSQPVRQRERERGRVTEREREGEREGERDSWMNNGPKVSTEEQITHRQP